MKKILSLIIAVLMVMGTMACVSAADQTIGEKWYSSNQTFELADDETITITGGITMEKDCKQLTFKGGNIVIDDFTADWAFYAKSGSILFEDVNIIANGMAKYFMAVNYGNTVTFKDCTITATGIKEAFMINDVGAGYMVLDNTKLYMPSGSNKISQLGTVTLTNGSLIDADNLSDRAFRNTTLNIDNSTIDVDGCENFIKNDGGQCITVTGTSTVSVSNITSSSDPAILLSNGAKITASSDDIVKVDGVAYEGVEVVAPEASGEIKLGYFNVNYSNNKLHAITGQADNVVGTINFVVELYSGEEKIGKAELVDTKKELLNGESKSISWHILLDAETDTDTYWNTSWTEGAMKVNKLPDKVKLRVDNEIVSEGDIRLNNADDSYPILAVVSDNNGNVTSFIAADGYTNNMKNVATKMNAAITAGGNITMVRDIVIDTPLVVPANTALSVDLNGKSISATSDFSGRIFKNEGTLTITGNGTLDTSMSANGYGAVDNYGTLTVNNGTFKGNPAGDGAAIRGQSGSDTTLIDGTYYGAPRAVSISSGASLKINGGTYYGITGYYVYTVISYGETTIDGGTVVGYQGCIAADEGKLTINDVDCQLIGYGGSNHCVYASGSNTEVVINGGTFDGTSKFTAENNGSTALCIDGANVVVKKGTFDGLHNDVAVIGGALKVLGGTYTDQSVKDYIAEGFEIAKNDDGTFGVQEEADKTLPNAEVKNLGAITVDVGSYYIYELVGDRELTSASEPFDLGVAMEFIAKDTPEEAAANYYGNYTTDFYITLDGMTEESFVANGCYLAGYYPSFEMWVKIPLDGFTIEKGKTYPVITSAGFDFNYVAICEGVQDFICGIYLAPEVLEANKDLTVKLELGLSENYDAAVAADSYIVVDKPYVYDVDDFGQVVVNWGAGTDAGFYTVEDTPYGMMRFLFSVDVYDEIVETGIKYIKTDNIEEEVKTAAGVQGTESAFFGDVTGIPEGTEGTYLAIAYVKTAQGTYWSDVVECSPDFTKHFTEYQAQ